MKRVTVRWAICVAVCLAAGLLATGDAKASDIVCHPRGGASPVVCADPNGNGMRCSLDVENARANAARHHLICESAGMSERYERIYAEQERMLHKGTIQNADITAWRARRDACDSARCLDSLFHLFWRDRGSMHIAPGAASLPRAAAGTSPPLRHDPPPASATLARHVETAAAVSQAPATQHGTQHGTQPAGFSPPPASAFETHASPVTAPAAAPVTAPVATPVDISLTATDTSGKTAEAVSSPLALESSLAGFAVIVTGGGFLWYRRHAYPQDLPRPSIPFAMVIAFALLLANVLLLPFTLGLK